MSLEWLDLVILLGYFAIILGVGLWFGRKERDTHDFFLGGRKQPWLIVGLSIVATEVSALTFIGVPADAFTGNWNYLQMYAGAFLGRMLIIWLLLPAFYGGNVTTVYEYLGQRFGPWTRTTGSLLFFVSRIIGSGIRLLAASIALATVFGWDLEWVILSCAAIAVAYTTFGGIKAIIWTDALQALIFIAGGLIAAGCLLYQISGGWTENLVTLVGSNKIDIVTWDWNPNNDKALWVLIIHATFLNMAALGTDQDLTQRMLTCPDLKRSRRSLLFNAFVGLPVVCLFLFIGSLLFLYFDQQPYGVPQAIQENTDRVFPYYIANLIPAGYGLRGLLLAGVFAAAMSSLDSALGALSSTAVTDFYRPWRVKKLGEDASGERAEKHYLHISRLMTVFFGVLLTGVAWAFIHQTALLWAVLKWAGLIFGGMLGIFLLGVTTKTRGHDKFNALAMLTSVAVLVLIKLYQEHPSVLGLADKSTTVLIAWPWWVVIGTVWTFLLAGSQKTREVKG